jgi:hypothetical protein
LAWFTLRHRLRARATTDTNKLSSSCSAKMSISPGCRSCFVAKCMPLQVDLDVNADVMPVFPFHVRTIGQIRSKCSRGENHRYGEGDTGEQRFHGLTPQDPSPALFVRSAPRAATAVTERAFGRAKDCQQYRKTARAIEAGSSAISFKRRRQFPGLSLASSNSSAAWRNKPAICLSGRPCARILRIHSTIGIMQSTAAKRLRSES